MDSFSDYLNSAKKSLFRFESLQDYKIDGEDESDEGMKEWWDFIASKKKQGVQMQRIKLVIRPLTKYTETELEIHKKSSSFGDDIRIIEEEAFKILGVKQEDFWIVDDVICLRMKYSNEGEYLGFDVVEKSVKKYLKIKKVLLKHSVSL
ncbi:hypothetical protein EPO17_01160 [Patescibacteria group bacterium]|nr:MAG: hypothetical protein EPO17_01160 [Patescibacteria group bacterium]